MAIEIEFSESENKPKKVSYVDELPERGSTLLEEIVMSEMEILTSKTKHWVYEQEYRIIHDEEFYPVPSLITAVYTGIRVSTSHRELLNKLVPPQIRIVETKLNAHRVQIEPNERMQPTAFIVG